MRTAALLQRNGGDLTYPRCTALTTAESRFRHGGVFRDSRMCSYDSIKTRGSGICEESPTNNSVKN